MEHNSRFKRPHLTKQQRLPQFIKDAEKVIKSVKSCKSNFKTVFANSRLRGSHLSKVYSLTLNVLKHYDYIQCIIKELKLLEKEKNLRSELATILIYEVIFGKGQLSGESKPVITIQGYTDDILNAHHKLQYSDSFSLKGLDLPRYARIHTLVTTVLYVIKDLEDIGFQQMFYDEGISEEKFVELVKSLPSGTFMVDFHFKDLLVFAHGENLMNLELYKRGHIFLQDKSSYIPVHALNPEPGSAVLDACAAPGMKSLHMAAKMKNKGILLACERDKARFETLKEMIQHGGVKISKLLCKDFKLMDPDDQAHCSLDYILLDPSCSGSGMVNRMDEVTDTEDSKNKDRLQKLAGFQIVLLKHALKFPSVKRVVYSTCSINEEENEYVVHEALSAFSNSFKLVPVMPEWSTRGSKSYEHGELCLRTLPKEHLMNGFFVAMFERLDGSENYIKNSQKHKGKKMKVEGEYLDVDKNEENINVHAYSSTSKKGKKYLHDSKISMEVKGEIETFEQNISVSSSRKRHKNDLCNSESSNTIEEVYEGIGSSEESKHLLEYSKKKRKSKKNRYEHENQSDCLNQKICTDIELMQKCEKEKKHKAKDITMKKCENKEESQQLENSNTIEEVYKGTVSSEESNHLLEYSKKKRKSKKNGYEHENQSDSLNQEICTDMELMQKCEEEKKHKAKDITVKKCKNKEESQQLENSNTIEEVYEGTVSSEESKHLLEYSKKKRKSKKNRYEHENQSDSLNQEICTDMELMQKCEKEKKCKAKDVTMKKVKNKEESSLRKISFNVEVVFQNSEIIDSVIIKHKKLKKNINDSEKIVIQEVTKDSVKDEFVSTRPKKKKRKKDEMMNYDADNLSKEHESNLTSFDKSVDNIESDITKRKKKHQDGIKGSDNTQTVMGEETSKIHENLKESNESLTRKKKRKKHKKNTLGNM